MRGIRIERATSRCIRWRGQKQKDRRRLWRIIRWLNKDTSNSRHKNIISNKCRDTNNNRPSNMNYPITIAIRIIHKYIPLWTWS